MSAAKTRQMQIPKKVDNLLQNGSSLWETIELLPLPVAAVDREGAILKANRAFCAFFHLPAEFCPGRFLADFFIGEQRETFRAKVDNLLGLAQGSALELQTAPNTGLNKWVRLSFMQTAHSNQPAGQESQPPSLAALHDITPFKEMELHLRHDQQRLIGFLNLFQATYKHEDDLIPQTIRQALEVTNSTIGLWFESAVPSESLTLRWRVQQRGEEWISVREDLSLDAEESRIWLLAVAENRAVLLNQSEIPAAFVQKLGLTALERMMVLPFNVNGTVRGVLAVAGNPRPYTPQDKLEVRLLLNFSQHILSKQHLRHKLEQNEQLYRHILGNVREMIYRIRLLPELRLEFVSPACLALTGYTAEELTARPEIMVEMIHPEESRLVEQLLSGEFDFHQPLIGRFIHRSGETRWAEQFINPVYDEAGRLTGFQSVVRDITERKQLEEALENAVMEYNILFDNVQDALFLIGVEEDGEFRFIRNNLAHQQLTGISLEELRGKTPIELVGKELGSQVSANYRRCLEAGRPIQYEETLDLPAGRRTWLTTLIPVIIDERIAYIVGDARDITELRGAQQSLAEKDLLYRHLFTNIREGFCIWEVVQRLPQRRLDFRLAEINPAGLKLLDLERSRAVGVLLSEVTWKVTPPVEEILEQALFENRFVEAEIFIHDLRKYWHIKTYPLSQNLIAEIFEDVTARRALEKERERMLKELSVKNNELENFTHTVSHDLKSPLITVRTFLGFIEESLASGDVETALADLRRVAQAAEKMQSLIDGLLELARIGRKLSLLTEIPLEEVIREAMDNLYGKIQAHQPPPEIVIQPGFPTITGDRLRLMQVFQNLLDNALKYKAENRPLRIEIGFEHKGDEIWIYVRDNGMGIPPKHLDKIFEIYQRANTAAPGSGIGLTIVQRIVELHGGRIWAESEGENRGSTFWFTLPLFPHLHPQTGEV